MELTADYLLYRLVADYLHYIHLAGDNRPAGGGDRTGAGGVGP